jgi:hypothetical protein
MPTGIDDPTGRPGLAAGRDELVAIDRHIAGKAGRSGPVADGSARYDDVVHQRPPWFRYTSGAASRLNMVCGGPAG